MIKYVAAWLVMLVVSIINGAMRDLIYGKHMTELRAHQLSTVTSIVLLGIVIWLFTSRYPLASAKQALMLGMFWAGLTLAFEFLFFHFVGKHSWAELLANYDVLHGRVWVFVVIWLLVAPYLFYIFRNTGAAVTN